MLLTSNHLPYTSVELNPTWGFGFFHMKKIFQPVYKTSVVLFRVGFYVTPTQLRSNVNCPALQQREVVK
jgi:hypothetical protein